MTSHPHHPDMTTAHQVTDPVCGMSVDPTATEHTADHHDERFYFCSAGCKATFVAAPGQYAGHDHGGRLTDRVHELQAVGRVPAHASARNVDPRVSR